MEANILHDILLIANRTVKKSYTAHHMGELEHWNMTLTFICNKDTRVVPMTYHLPVLIQVEVYVSAE